MFGVSEAVTGDLSILVPSIVGASNGYRMAFKIPSYTSSAPRLQVNKGSELPATPITCTLVVISK